MEDGFQDEGGVVWMASHAIWAEEWTQYIHEAKEQRPKIIFGKIFYSLSQWYTNLHQYQQGTSDTPPTSNATTIGGKVDGKFGKKSIISWKKS